MGIVIQVILNILIVGRRDAVEGNYELHMTVKADKVQQIQVYYSQSREVTDELSQTLTYNEVGDIHNSESICGITTGSWK